MRAFVSPLAFVAALLGVSPAWAEAPAPTYPPAAVGVGAHAAVLFGDRCKREANDLVACARAGTLGGVHLDARYRTAPFFSAGVRGARSSDGGHATWWDASLTARFHLLPSATHDLWLSFDAGLVATSESVQGDGLGTPTTRTERAPLVGVGGGIDFRLVRFVYLGPSIRGVLAAFHSSDAGLPARGTSLGTQVGAEIGVTVTLRLDR